MTDEPKATDTEAAIAAATKEVEWAVELLLSGELSTLPLTEAHAEVEKRLQGRSKVAAEAVHLALADIREMSLDAKNPKVLQTIATLYVEDLLMGRLEPRSGPSGKPCECEEAVTFSNDEDETVKVRCVECSSVWSLKRWLSETVKRIQASEARRLGRPLTGWEAHSIDDQCYFRTLPRGEVGVRGDEGS